MLEILRSVRTRLTIKLKCIGRKLKVKFEAFRTNAVIHKDAFKNKMNVLIKSV